MSHFTVLIIGREGYNDIDEALLPYGEESEDFFEWNDKTDEVLADYAMESIENLEKYETLEKYVKEYYGYEELHGRYGYNSNPNGQWDWYQVGGRWSGSIPLKSGGFVDSAEKGDIDIEALKVNIEVYKDSVRLWELIVDEQEVLTPDEKLITEGNRYKKEYFLKNYTDKDSYAKSMASFVTYAVVLDGVWHQKGRMGWFGMSDETDEEATAWDNNFFKAFIEELEDDAYITLVDCHI
jgi:hypothetical protein